MFPRSSVTALATLLAAGPLSAASSFDARVMVAAPGQPAGALSGKIVYTSGGHGWTYHNASDQWYTQRGDNNEVVEDYGNLDQMNLFAAHCLNAGATVVAFRPIGYQTDEVILDNTSPAVRFSGSWTSSSATRDYYGAPGSVPYQFAAVAATETATATYTPTLPATGFYPIY